MTADTPFATGVAFVEMRAFTSCMISRPSLCLSHPRCDCDPSGSAIGSEVNIVRSPTLSYTQRLEQRVAELERSLTKEASTVGETSVSSCSNIPSPALDSPLSQGPSSVAESTRVTGKRGILFPESTSLFQLPGSLQIHALESNQTDQDVDARRERLVNSAWRERAFEKIADTPVSSFISSQVLRLRPGNRSHIGHSWIPTFAGFNPCSISSTGQRSHVSQISPARV